MSPENPLNTPAPERPDPIAPEPQGQVEDAGSVALSEALRSSFFIVRILLAALVVYFLVSNVKSIGSQERAIVLRFGKPVVRDGQAEQGPGLVWAFPYPIDEVVRIPVTELQLVRSSVGWYAVTPAQEAQGIVPDAGPSLSPAAEGYAITGDGNIMHARAFVRYRITEPVKFHLNHRNGPALMTNLVDNALMYAAARFTVDDALVQNVTGFKEVMLRRLSELVAEHDLGVTIEPSDVQTLPPRQVRAEFDAVLNAQLERDRRISEAQGYANRVLNEAQGQATAVLNAGRAERNRMIQEVTAESESFARLLPEYQKNPDYFRDRLTTETLRRVLTNASQKFVFPPMSGEDQLRLHLNREPPAPSAPSQQP